MSYPLSTFVSCYSGFSFFGPFNSINCTNNFKQNIDYTVSNRNCFAVLTSQNWFKVHTIVSSSVSALDYFSVITSSLSSTTTVVVSGTNQPYLTGSNINTNAPNLCTYSQSVSSYLVDPILRNFKAENWSVGPGGAMNLFMAKQRLELSAQHSYFYGYPMTACELRNLSLKNVLLSGINIENGTQLVNLSNISFTDTAFSVDQFSNIMGNGINKFLFHLSSYAPNNGYFTSKNDLNFGLLNIIGKNSLHALTATKNWTVNIS